MKITIGWSKQAFTGKLQKVEPRGLDSRSTCYVWVLKGSRLTKFQFAQRSEKDKRDINCYSTKFAREFQTERNNTVLSKQPREVVQLPPSERFQTRTDGVSSS